MILDAETTNAVARFATRLGVEAAALLAVVEVESNGVTHALVKGRREPVIRWEGHYFDRRLKGAARDRARREGLAHPAAGAIKNPKGQAERWTILNRASEIDATAAFESISIGVGQVMGAHWQWLGFASVTEMVNTARSGVSGQIELMVRFIEKSNLEGALRRRDWAAFARAYNGPAYEKNAYHTKMAAAYRRHGGASPIAPSADGMLRLGSKGARVRELQQLLVRSGRPVTVDGDFGPATDSAVRDFQKWAALEVDGVAGPATMRAIDLFRQGGSDTPGQLRAADVQDVRDGIGGAGGGVAIEVARQQLDEVAARLSSVPGLELVSSGIGLVAASLVIGGLGWAAWSWWKSRQTVEAPE